MDELHECDAAGAVTVIVYGDDPAGLAATLDSIARQTLAPTAVVHEAELSLRANTLRSASTAFAIELHAGDVLAPTALERLVWTLATMPSAAAIVLRQSEMVERFAELSPSAARELASGTESVRCLAVRLEAVRAAGDSPSARGDGVDRSLVLSLATAGFAVVELTGDLLASEEAHATTPDKPSRARSALGRRIASKLELDGVSDDLSLFELLARMAPNRLKGRLWRGLGLPVRPDRWRFTPELRPRPAGLPLMPVPEDDRLRVLVLHPYLIAGGAESLVLNLLTYTDRERVDMHLITTDPTPGRRGDSPWLRRFNSECDNLFQLHGFLDPAYHLRYLIDYITTRRIDVVVISLSVFGYNALPQLRAHCPGVAFVDVIHAEAPYEPMDHIRLAAAFRGLLDRRVVTTGTVREIQCARHGETCERIETIPNGIDTAAAFNPARYDADAFRGRAGIAAEASLVLFFGRLVAEKQPSHVLEVARLLAHRADIAFAIVGEGPLRGELEAQIARDGVGNVRLCLPEANIASALAAATLTMFPSKREGLPMAGIESLSMAVPIIASRVPGWTDLVEDGRTGVLVDDGDFAGYAAAIERLVDDVPARDALARAARGRAVETYDARACAQRWASMLERVGGSTAAPVSRVSIVIVAYNSEELLPACLRSLQENPPGLPWEVVCVDNGSTDGTAELLARDYPWVQTVAAEGNLGFAGGNVLGVRHARGDLLLLLNPDTVVLPGAVDALVGALLADERRHVAGACLVQEDGSPGTSWGDFPTLGWALINTAPFARIGLKLRSRSRMGSTCADLKEVTEVDWASGAAFLVRRSAWNTAGGMDPDYFLYYEETDLCYRIRRAEGAVVVVPHARIMHLEGAVVGTLSARQYAWSTRSLIRFLRRNRGWAPALVLRAWVLVVNLLLALVALVAGPLSPRLRRERSRYAALIGVALGRAARP